ncbi:MAG: hypothetical protein KDB01_14110 [Planctomycetaceae bacterium]|nr:hypothetical protein [Planctomycetaceae bacterium]
MPEPPADSHKKKHDLQATWTISDLGWVLGMYRRYWLLVVMMVLISTGSAILITIVRGPQYEVGAALYLKLGAEMAPPASIAKEPVMVTRRTEDVNTEIELLRSPHLIRKVIQDLGEDFFAEEPPQTTFQKARHYVKQQVRWVRNQVDDAMIKVGLRRRLSEMDRVELVLGQALTVEPVRNSDIIYLSLQISDPKGGEFILQKILDTYLELHMAAHKNPGLAEFFVGQTALLRKQLTDNSNSLLSFKTANKLWSADGQRSQLLERQRLLQQQHSATLGIVASLEAESASLHTSLTALPETVELSRTLQHNPALTNLKSQLTALGLNSEVVAAGYTENSAERRTADQQLKYVNRQLESAVELLPFSITTGLNQIRSDLGKIAQAKSAELSGLQRQLVVETEQINAIESNLLHLEEAITQFNELNREHELLERNYLLYSESAEKSRIASVLNQSQISNISVVTPPTASLAPVAPRMKLVLGSGVFAGFVLASVLALVFESRRERSPKKTASK